MEPPRKPDESDCCNSGCDPCILDVYEDQLRKYRDRTLKTDTSNCLSQTSYAPFELVERAEHTWNTALMTFRYRGPPRPDDQLSVNYKPGQHLLMKGRSSYSDHFTRAYTPVPLNKGDPLAFTVLVKFYEHGQMSAVLRRLKCGEETMWRGPYGPFEISYDHRRILLIGQGVGVAPLYAIVREMVNDYECETFLKLFLCCRSERDILLRDELYECGRYWNFSYEIFLSASDGDVKSKYNEVVHGERLNIDTIKAYVDSNADGLRVLICGREGFMEDMKRDAIGCGVSEANIVLF